MTKRDPLQTWLTAVLTFFCILVAIGSAKAASTISPQPPEPSPTSAQITVEGKDRYIASIQYDGEPVLTVCEVRTQGEA